MKKSPPDALFENLQIRNYDGSINTKIKISENVNP
jgi:hypothetical protein